MGAYKDIHQQFASDAAFLWLLRSQAVNQPHYTRQDLRQLEQRINSHLDGLMTAIEESWPVCVEALSFDEAGEAFVATVVAFRSHDVRKIQVAVEAGLSNPDTERGFISALGWLPAKLVHGWLEKFVNSKNLDHKLLAVGGFSLRRENPGASLERILERDDCRQHHRLYARSLRLAGELRRLDLLPQIEAARDSDSEDVAFWANWAAVLLGDLNAVENLKSDALTPAPRQARAIDLAFRVLPVERGRQWIAALAETPEQVRDVIRATGTLGDPQAVNWLLGKMQQPELARIAGEAFANITGINLEESQLTRESDADSMPPVDDDSAEIDLDEDEHLPWPDADKIEILWRNHGDRFVAGQRYFLGREPSAEFFCNILESGYQRQRHAAALELALIDPQRPLPNTRATEF